MSLTFPRVCCLSVWSWGAHSFLDVRARGWATDMDLCCLLNKKEGQTEERSASVLVEILGQLIREETDFNVMMLPKARIPIIKISRGELRSFARLRVK